MVHFLLLGGLLFAIGLARGESASPASNRIVLTQGVIERLMEGFRMTWRRPPTESEFRGLVEDYLKEEVLYREAIAMGLDQGDEIIRRRLRQKLEFMTADFVGTIEPGEADLLTYLAEHADQYRLEALLSFRHIFLRPGPDSAATGDRAASVLAELCTDPERDPTELGDPFLYPAVFSGLPEYGIAATFGPEFLGAVLELPVGEWTGPIPSAYGLHLVRVDAREPGRLPELAEVRDAVNRDLVSDLTRKAEEAYFQGLLGQYVVTVEWPEGMEAVDLPGVAR